MVPLFAFTSSSRGVDPHTAEVGNEANSPRLVWCVMETSAHDQSPLRITARTSHQSLLNDHRLGRSAVDSGFLAMIELRADRARRITPGADKGYDHGGLC
jgi:hypothetical protein